MANILKGNEETTTLVLANVCIAFVVLAAYSPVTSKPYLLIAATALALLSLYPLYLILQRPRRFIVVKETEGGKSLYVVRFKGYLWWYDAKDRNGDAVVFNSMADAQKYIKEDVVTVLINYKMRRKSMKREFAVILDSKKMNDNNDASSPAEDTAMQEKNNGKEQTQGTPPTPQPEKPEKIKIVPDNNATIANLFAMGKASQNEMDMEEDGEEEEEEEEHLNLKNDSMDKEEEKETKQENGVYLQKQQSPEASEKDPPADGNSETETDDGDWEDYSDDPFDSRYQVPDDENETEDADTPPTNMSDDGRHIITKEQIAQIEILKFNEEIFDVIDKFNKLANNQKPSKKPKSPPTSTESESTKVEPPKAPLVTTAQIVEEQALVHAHKAETVKDALTKILYHQQMTERKKEMEEEKTETPAPKPEHQKIQAIPKSRRNKKVSPDNIPTKTIKRRPSSEESFLRKQMSFLEIPGFVDPLEEEEISGDKDSVEAKETVPVAVPHKEEPGTVATENNGSSGGPKIAKKLENADVTGNAPSTTQTANIGSSDEAVPEDKEEVFTHGSESKAEEPADIDGNAYIQASETHDAHEPTQELEPDDFIPNENPPDDDGDTLQL